MSQRSDWLPANREGQLAMAKEWKPVMTANAGAWGITPAVLTEFDTLIQAADAALAAAKNESTRTPVATAQCKIDFEALAAKMRDIKRRYFLTPPLTAADFVALGLKLPDPTHTPSGNPTAQVGQKAYGFLPRSLRLTANSTQLLHGNYWLEFCHRQNSQAIRRSRIARHELGVKFVYVTGSPADPANKGYRIYYRAAAPGETPPARPEDLTQSFFTRRKKDKVEFDYGDSGKTAYFAVQVENDGKKGEWGPMVNALIP